MSKLPLGSKLGHKIVPIESGLSKQCEIEDARVPVGEHLGHVLGRVLGTKLGQAQNVN